MPNCLRPGGPGATVYFTLCLARRGPALLVDRIDILREAVAHTRKRRPFAIDARVVLPDHMHAVWTLPEDDASYSQRWGMIRSRFSRLVRERDRAEMVGSKPTLRRTGRVGFHPTEAERMRAARSPSKVEKGNAGIWPRWFWGERRP